MRNKFLVIIIAFLCFSPFDLAAQQKQPSLHLNKKLSSNAQPQLAYADSALARAERFSNKAAFDSALTNYEIASAIYLAAAQKAGKTEIWENYLKSENGRSNVLYQQSKYKEALQSSEKILEIGIAKLGRLHAGVARCQNIIGNTHHRLGQYDLALEYHFESLRTRRQLYGENHAAVAASLSNIGIVHQTRGNYVEALNYQLQAFEIQKKVNNNPGLAIAYTNMGICYLEMSKYDLALECQTKALTLRQKILSSNHPYIATNHNNLGNIYYYKRDFEQALSHFQNALAINLKAFGENHLETSRVYLNIANIYKVRGDYDKALEYESKSLSLKIKLFGRVHENVVRAYNNIGITYQQIGDLEKALECHGKALEIQQQVLGAQHPDVAVTYHNLGNIYFSRKMFDEALEYHDKALKIREVVLGEFHYYTAGSYNAIGNVFLQKGDMAEALQNFQKALKLRKQLFNHNHPNVANSLIHIGEVFVKKDEIKTGLQYLQKSLISLVPSFRDTSFMANPGLPNARSPLELFRALEIKARALRRLFDQTQDFVYLKGSLKTNELAVDLAAMILQDYQGEESKFLLNKRRAGLLVEAMATALILRHKLRDETYDHHAFRIASSSKAHVLSQAILASRAKNFASIPDSFLQRERGLQIDMAYYKTAAQKQYMKQKPDSLELANLEDRYFSLRREYESLVAYFEKAYPKYFGLKFKNDTPAVKELQKILDAQAALVEYFLSDSSLYIFTVTRNDFKITVSAIDSSLQKAISAYSNSFKSFTGQAREKYRQNSVTLYQKLIQPVEKYIADKPRWVIIPHNELCQIPFEALLRRAPAPREDDTKLDYLIKHHEISYHYSAALFLSQRLTQQKNLLAAKAPSQTKRHGERLATRGFIGFAPVFSDNVANGRIARRDAEIAEILADSTFRGENTFRETAEGLKVRPLPYSEIELEKIHTLFLNKKQVSIGYFHHDASEEKFKTEAGKFKIVHVSTHGLYNGKYPNLSGLVFSQYQPTPTNDGLLYAAEAYNLELDADLLVLSSCESAGGPLQKGEGLMALTRAFIYAGAENIVASLWKVRDQHTSELMITFYEEILQGQRYAEALRAAKLQMIANLETAGPQSWAGFILIGR